MESRLQQLFDRWYNRQASPEETEELFALLSSSADDELPELVKQQWEKLQPVNFYTSQQKEELATAILQKHPAIRESAKVFSIKRWAAAAAILLVLLTGSYFLWFNKPTTQESIAGQPESIRFKNEISPGSDKAILVLANGREVTLGDSASTITAENGQAIRNADGTISYSNINAAITAYHTLKIPRKGEYELKLQDGTMVKLNSESSISYPIAFNGNERKVSITGEAYFEVAKEANKPFIVDVNGTEIKVLGTHFNVNAYLNEAAIKTTLTEGAVEITAGNKTIKLNPGQQARVNNNELTVVTTPNEAEVLAWTTGYFNFREADIKTIMRQVERWYDVDVQYAETPAQLFVAKIPRNVNVTDFFRILEATGWVHFNIDGRKITVLK